MPRFPVEAISKNTYVMGKEFERLGHEVKVIPLFRGSDSFRRFLSLLNPLSLPIYYASLQRKLNNTLELFNPDILFTHFGLVGTNLILTGKLKPFTFVYSYPASRNDIFLLLQEMIRSNIISGLRHSPSLLSALYLNNSHIFANCLRRSAGALFTSKDLHDRFGDYSSNSRVVNLAISEEEFIKSRELIENRFTIRKNWNLSEKETVLGYLGHPSLIKGLDLVIKNFVNLHDLEKGRKLKLLLAPTSLGFVNVLRMLENLPPRIRNDILIHKQVDSLEFISVLDLLLFPIRSHIGTTAIPRTVLEALLVGTPVIVGSASSSIKQFVEDGTVLPTDHSISSLFHTSKEVLDDLGYFRQRILLKRMRILSIFHVKKITEELMHNLFTNN